eukprot:TCONS_00029398-protein
MLVTGGRVYIEFEYEDGRKKSKVTERYSSSLGMMHDKRMKETNEQLQSSSSTITSPRSLGSPMSLGSPLFLGSSPESTDLLDFCSQVTPVHGEQPTQTSTPKSIFVQTNASNPIVRTNAPTSTIQTNTPKSIIVQTNASNPIVRTNAPTSTIQTNTPKSIIV